MPGHKVAPKAWSWMLNGWGPPHNYANRPTHSHFLNISISIWHAYRYHLQFKGISLTYHPKEHFVRTKAVFLKRVSLPLPQERIFLFKGKAQENNHSWVIFHRFMAHTIRNSKPKWFCQKKKKKKSLLRAGCWQQWWVRVWWGYMCGRVFAWSV